MRPEAFAEAFEQITGHHPMGWQRRLFKEFVGGVSDLWPAILGAILIIVTLLVPDGIAGTLVQAWKFVTQRIRRNARI